MKKPKFLLSFFIVAFLGIFAVYNLPPVQDRLGWRVAELMARFKYAIAPPEEVVFVPQEKTILSTPTVPVTPATTTAASRTTAAITPSATPDLLDTPTRTPTPIPQNIKLTGFKHEYQTWNNCGPATLGMALSYWGWVGDQRPLPPSPNQTHAIKT